MFKQYAVHFGGGTIVLIGSLTSLFLILKLTHLIHWSYVWILSPLWIPMGFASALALGFLAFLAVIAVCVYLFGRREEDT